MPTVKDFQLGAVQLSRRTDQVHAFVKQDGNDFFLNIVMPLDCLDQSGRKATQGFRAIAFNATTDLCLKASAMSMVLTSAEGDPTTTVDVSFTLNSKKPEDHPQDFKKVIPIE